MVLVDARRLQVDANAAYLSLLGYSRKAVIGTPVYAFVADGPLATAQEWDAFLASRRFSGEADLVCASGARISVQWGASVEVVTGRRLVLFVILSTSRWGQRFRRALTPEPEPGALTKREREVVRLVARGSTGPEIAEELHIAHDTVRTHVRNAMTKLGARSRAHLVAKALGDGLTSTEHATKREIAQLRYRPCDRRPPPCGCVADSSPLRVLIVDDQAAFPNVARRVLEWRGYLVAGEADCATAALDAAVRLAPDAVLLDVGLGRTSGFELASALKQACPRAAVLLVSACDYRHCAALLRACGARGFLLKSELAHADLAGYWPASGA